MGDRENGNATDKWRYRNDLVVDVGLLARGGKS